MATTIKAAPTGLAASPSQGRLPFNRPHATGAELDYIRQALANGHLSGNGPFTERCTAWLEDRIGSVKALLTASCTAALELAVILAGVEAGDEVLVPSFTFVSTASAVALRGATPVFVDVRPDTLNLDEQALARAVTSRTKAIIPVHYAGVGCAMGEIEAVAAEHDLTIIEDAAQAIVSEHDGRPLGGIGALGCLSFHETKNVGCGEGGALLVNDPALVERAEILQEKGTNRTSFARGEVDKYTWVDLGSSFLTSEVNAAYLWAQLERAEAITARRVAIWEHYHEAFADLELAGLLRRPVVPAGSTTNGHLYHLLLPDQARRDALIADLAADGVQSVFHYVPLHSSPAGWRYGRAHGELPVTTDIASRLVRLPLWPDLEAGQLDRVVRAVRAAVLR